MTLNEREQAIVTGLAQGKTLKEIADMKWKKPKQGEWIQPVPRAYKLACCDCGLVHTVHFRIYSGRVQMKVYRNEKLTRTLRKEEAARIKWKAIRFKKYVQQMEGKSKAKN